MSFALLAATLGAARAQQVPTEVPGTVQVTAGAGWRRVAEAGLAVQAAAPVALAVTAGLRHDRPAWVPTATAVVRVGAPLGPVGLGARMSAEWLGGALTGGRAPGVDLRAVALVETAPRATWRGHAGAGLQGIAMARIRPMGCVLARTGASVRLTDRASAALDLEAPIARLFGPEVPGIDAQVWLRVRAAIGGAAR